MDGINKKESFVIRNYLLPVNYELITRLYCTNKSKEIAFKNSKNHLNATTLNELKKAGTYLENHLQTLDIFYRVKLAKNSTRLCTHKRHKNAHPKFIKKK